MGPNVSKERSKLLSKKVLIGIIVAIVFLIIIVSSTRTPAYQQPQVQHSQEYLDLREYHIDSWPRKAKVIESTERMGN